ncbi:uncharacterized protein TNCV_4555701 [Trichonephila clavipes]|nr:uncharacterized protein TNCV_4555701 [Trichonephila clavipes]
MITFDFCKFGCYVDPDGEGCSDFKTRRHFSGSATFKAKAAAQERERCYLDPDFEPVKSPLGSPRASVTSVTSGASTLSTQSGGKDSSKQRYEITKAGLAKFAKRLTSKDKSSNNKLSETVIQKVFAISCRPSGIVASDADCCAVWLGFEYWRRHGCLQMYSAFVEGGILNNRQATSPFVRLREEEDMWKPSDYPQGVLPQNWGENESNRTVTCMVLKATDNDRRTI